MAGADAGGRPGVVALVVQARMTSTRLPGKVLAPVLGRPLLAIELERLRSVRRADRLVVATSANAADDPVAAVAAEEGFGVVRGSEHDVLDRFAQAARAVDANVVVRITADCPLIDPEIVDTVIERYLAGGCDYVSNTLQRTYPRGLDVEVLGAAALRAAAEEAVSPADREHVTSFVYGHPERFRIAQVLGAADHARHRWTVDEPADLELVRRLLEELLPRTPDFRMRDVLEVLAAHPEWADLNQAVSQRTHLDAERP